MDKEIRAVVNVFMASFFVVGRDARRGDCFVMLVVDGFAILVVDRSRS